MERPLTPPAADARWLNGVTLALVCLGLYLPLFWQMPLLRSEAMYALIPQEMLAAGSWLTPTLNGAPYLDKPHLLYWLQLLSYKLLGVSEWSARVPTLAMTVGEVWLTYLIGRRLVGRLAAWLGGFILLTCIGFFVLHLLILTDHLITLSLLAALYALLRWEAQPGFRWTALFFLALVAGFLSKGFIGLVFPGLIGLLYAWHLRERRLLRLFFSPVGLGLTVMLLVAWGWATELANPGFLKFQIVNEQIMRFLGRREPPDVNSFTVAGFYVFLFIWLMPWAFILPEALYRFWQATRPGREVGAAGRLLLIWVLVILGFFTLSSSRIEYYSLPAMPALALILGWRIKRYLDTPGDRVIPWTLLALGLFRAFAPGAPALPGADLRGQPPGVQRHGQPRLTPGPAGHLALSGGGPGGGPGRLAEASPPGRGRLWRPGRGYCLVHLPGPDDPYSPDGRQSRGRICQAGGLPPGPVDHGAHRRV